MSRIGRGHRLQRRNFAILRREFPPPFFCRVGFLSRQKRRELRESWHVGGYVFMESSLIEYSLMPFADPAAGVHPIKRS